MTSGATWSARGACEAGGRACLSPSRADFLSRSLTFRLPASAAETRVSMAWWWSVCAGVREREREKRERKSVRGRRLRSSQPALSRLTPSITAVVPSLRRTMTDSPPCPYATLGIPVTATLSTIKTAFRAAARATHPDRAAAAAAVSASPSSLCSFTAARAAYELLTDPARRAAHDACARSAPGGVAPPPASVARAAASARAARAATGGEEALLAGWAPPGPVCPAHQLVITCEACRRPATAACWVCGMDLCAFCTRTPHWKVKVDGGLSPHPFNPPRLLSLTLSLSLSLSIRAPRPCTGPSSTRRTP